MFHSPPPSESMALWKHKRNKVLSSQMVHPPFAIAIRHNAFHLAATLISLGANPNALTLSSGLFTSTYPLTILGHVIISNARYSSARLKHLLHLNNNNNNNNNKACNFIVEPSRQPSALHCAAMAHIDISKAVGEEIKKDEFDKETNRDVMYEILLRWRRISELNGRCKMRGNTALYLAVEAGNFGAVESLVDAGADGAIVNEEGETALEMAENLAGESGLYGDIVK